MMTAMAELEQRVGIRFLRLYLYKLMMQSESISLVGVNISGWSQTTTICVDGEETAIFMQLRALFTYRGKKMLPGHY